MPYRWSPCSRMAGLGLMLGVWVGLNLPPKTVQAQPQGTTPTDSAQSLASKPGEGHYLLCNGPVPTPQEMIQASSCFATHKVGQRMVGMLYTPHKGDPICIEGTLNQGILTGKAYEVTESSSSDPRQSTAFKQAIQQEQSRNGSLVNQGEIIAVRSVAYADNSPEYLGLLRYHQATLDLSDHIQHPLDRDTTFGNQDYRSCADAIGWP